MGDDDDDGGDGLEREGLTEEKDCKNKMAAVKKRFKLSKLATEATKVH